ncbi:unnamed protein product [Kuraishia capsulata CBS 1993]|uniref:Uncharacterized protein n=1 Tax=Kuraishia capsulata CBS 1993 TaxID=1382522 RepID=W6MQM7_9ASCO|nr:uncharacterized protein KUCA_T00004972001 [Kuraishia capsulata CBS 1993]CDK28986.1 unnamed protein product [Kuraishia capsulata CBS 1993]
MCSAPSNKSIPKRSQAKLLLTSATSSHRGMSTENSEPSESGSISPSWQATKCLQACRWNRLLADEWGIIPSTSRRNRSRWKPFYPSPNFKFCSQPPIRLWSSLRRAA